MRCGEKLYEELFYSNEEKTETLYAGIMLASARDIDFAILIDSIQQIHAACDDRDSDKVLSLLSKVVPEYSPNAVGQLEAKAA